MLDISALLPIRNGAQYLPAAIRSIEANQELLDHIIVVEDGSSDDTLKLLVAWASRNEKVHVIPTQGIGLVNALNLGIAESTTRWIARFDVDDNYSSNRITSQASAISGKTVGVFSDYNLFSSKFGKLGFLPSAITPSAVSLSLIKNRRTTHPSVLMNVDAVKSVGCYRVEDFPAEDYSLWLRLNKTGDLISVPERLLNYRISESSVTATHRNDMILRSLELKRAIGIPIGDIEDCIENFEETFRLYETAIDFHVRSLLHLLEIRKAVEEFSPNISANFKISSLMRPVIGLSAPSDYLKFGSGLLKRRLVKNLI